MGCVDIVWRVSKTEISKRDLYSRIAEAMGFSNIIQSVGCGIRAMSNLHLSGCLCEHRLQENSGHPFRKIPDSVQRILGRCRQRRLLQFARFRRGRLLCAMSLSKRKLVSDEVFLAAVEAVRSGQSSLRQASERFGVPRFTLHDACKSNVAKRKQLGRPPVLPPDLEEAVASRILALRKLCYGITTRKLRTAVVERAVLINIAVPERWIRENAAGWYWYYEFVKRHPTISLRRPQNMSYGRLTGFTDDAVKSFFGCQ